MAGHTNDELIELVRANNAAVASKLLGPLAQFATIARELCGGDADKVLLMLVIAMRANSHPAFQAGDPEALADADGALPSLGINLRSLADSTGIPRETVRRKVGDLVRDGWVIQRGGMLHYGLAGFRAVEPARMAIIRIAVSSYRVVSALEEAAPD